VFPAFVFQLSQELDFAANVALGLLFLVFVYLVLTRVLPKGARAYSRKPQRGAEAAAKASKLEQLRAGARSELSELESQVSHLKQVKMEIRKNYMKGEIDADAFKQLDRENEHRLVDSQARLHALQQVAKSQQ